MTKDEVEASKLRMNEFKKMREEAKRLCIVECIRRGIDLVDSPTDYSYSGQNTIGAMISYNRDNGTMGLITVEFDWNYDATFIPIWDIANPNIRK